MRKNWSHVIIFKWQRFLRLHIFESSCTLFETKHCGMKWASESTKSVYVFHKSILPGLFESEGTSFRDVKSDDRVNIEKERERLRKCKVDAEGWKRNLQAACWPQVLKRLGEGKSRTGYFWDLALFCLAQTSTKMSYLKRLRRFYLLYWTIHWWKTFLRSEKENWKFNSHRTTDQRSKFSKIYFEDLRRVVFVFELLQIRGIFRGFGRFSVVKFIRWFFFRGIDILIHTSHAVERGTCMLGNEISRSPKGSFEKALMRKAAEVSNGGAVQHLQCEFLFPPRGSGGPPSFSISGLPERD